MIKIMTMTFKLTSLFDTLLQLEQVNHNSSNKQENIELNLNFNRQRKSLSLPFLKLFNVVVESKKGTFCS